MTSSTSDSSSAQDSNIFNEVAGKKKELENFFYKIDVLERNLLYKEMDEDERDKLEAQLKDLKEELRRQEELIQNLNSEKMYNYTVATMVFMFTLCVYVLVRLAFTPHE
eukprot:TRINITY_DN7192_c0_g1_i1.p1 TRINITY_DN7192_c0_g1~~TRINITY_DN7192_c0_g1_i1.p1  ORF type:complete len:109 (+),score=24.34 TRINITY_DN7192_c0_g1_i1:30-356(+)